MNAVGSMASRVATSSLFLLAESIFRLALTAAVSFWIARQLGPGQFGILNFASAFMAILLSVAALGMDTPLILRLTRTQQPGALLGTALAIRSAASLLVFGLALILAFLMKHDEPVALATTMIVCLSILGYIPSVLDFLFKSRTDAARPALARTGATIVSSAAKMACLLLGLGVIALAWTVVLEALLASLGLYLAYRACTRASHRDRLTVDRQLLMPLLRESVPYLYSSVAILLYMKIDVVMLGYLSSDAETGIYSLAQKLSEVLYIVPVVLIDSAYPTLAHRFMESDKGNPSHGQMLFDLATGSALLAILLALVLAGPVIEYVFGSAYGPSTAIFHLHAWSCIAIAMNTARHRWLATLGLQRYAPTVTTIGLVLNVAMNLVLIPRMGALGAAIATVVSYFVSGYLSSFLLPPLREIGRMQTRSLWPWGRLYAGARVWHAGRKAA